MARPRAAKSFKMSEIIGKLGTGDRVELERLFYVPGKPNYAGIVRALAAMGHRVGKDAVAGWWESEGQHLYKYVPAETALHQILGCAVNEYLECLEWMNVPEVSEARRTALQMMAGKEDGGNVKGALALGRHMRELEKGIRATAEGLHNLEVREAKAGLIAATAQQAIDYLLQAMHNEGLEQVNLSNLETLGNAAIARILAENGIGERNPS